MPQNIRSVADLSTGGEAVIREGILRLALAVSACAHEHGWWSDPGTGAPVQRNMGEMIALMHSELSEALESWRDGEPPLWYKYPAHVQGNYPINSTQEFAGERELGKAEGLAAEFADCIIRILDTCETLKIPLVDALIDKHRYNQTRPYRHGGKKA